MALLLIIAQTPLFRLADAPPSDAVSRDSNRDSNLDGLRGFLALAVFFHHAIITHEYIRTGVWAAPPVRFYALLGPFGVSVFFLITAYLFWGKCLRASGRIKLPEFYIGRVFRIGPVYLLVIACMLAFVLASTGAPTGGLTKFVRESATWLPLGITTGGNVNGLAHTSNIVAGVTWSLIWEWRFYFALPFLAYLLIRLPRTPVLLYAATAGLVVLFLLSRLPVNLTLLGHHLHLRPHYDKWLRLSLLFAFGMCCASLRFKGLTFRVGNGLLSGIAAALIALQFLACRAGFDLLPILLCALFFYVIVSGATFWGLLLSRPAIRLGNVSYGIYLMQGLVLHGVFLIPPVRQFFMASALAYWSGILLCGFILITLATLAHAAIERPGIALGHRTVRALRAIRPASRRGVKPELPAAETGSIQATP